MQFKNSYNSSFADRDSERKPPSVPIAGPTGVGVPHAKVAPLSSSGLAASSAHGSQAPAAYQGSNRLNHNSSHAAKGPNSEAYLPPALRNQNHHGIAGTNSDFGSHGASSNGYGSDFTRQQQQQHFPSQSQFQQPNQTYGHNQDDENQGRWTQPSHVKRDAQPSSSQFNKYPEQPKQQQQHHQHPSYPSHTPFNEKGPNQYQHQQQQNASGHTSFPPYEQWSDSAPPSRGGPVGGGPAPPASEAAGSARGGRGGGHYQGPGGGRGGGAGGGGSYNNGHHHHQFQGGEGGAPHSVGGPRGGFGGGGGSAGGGPYGREDSYHHPSEQQYQRQPYHQPPLHRRGGGRGGGGYGHNHNYNHGPGNSGPNRFHNQHGPAHDGGNSYPESRGQGQQYHHHQQPQQHPREGFGPNQTGNPHLGHGPPNAYHQQPPFKGPPSPNEAPGKPQLSLGGYPGSNGVGNSSPPSAAGNGHAPGGGGGSHVDGNGRTPYFNGNGSNGGSGFRENNNGPPKSLIPLDSRHQGPPPPGSGGGNSRYHDRDVSPNGPPPPPQAVGGQFQESTKENNSERGSGGNNFSSSVSPRHHREDQAAGNRREDQAAGNRHLAFGIGSGAGSSSSQSGGAISPLLNPPSLLSSPDASADWTPGIKEPYFKEATSYLQQQQQNLGSGFPNSGPSRNSFQGSSPREPAVESPPAPKPSGLYQPPAQRRQQQQLQQQQQRLHSPDSFEPRFIKESASEGPASFGGGAGGRGREEGRRGFQSPGQQQQQPFGSGPERGPRGGFQPTPDEAGKAASGSRDFRGDGSGGGISPLLPPSNGNSRSESPRGGPQESGKWSGPRLSSLTQSDKGSPGSGGAPSPLLAPGESPNLSNGANRGGQTTPNNERGTATPPSGSVGPLGSGGRSLPVYPAGGRGSTGSVGSHNSRAATPSSSVASVSDQDRIFKKVRGILNKLTPDKFDKLSLELLNVGIDSPQILKGIILLIFEKALDEPKYSSLYAQLCRRLHDDAPDFDPPAGGGVNGQAAAAAAAAANSSFSRLLLNKCKDEFENRYKATNEFELKRANNHGKPLTDDEEEQALIAKSKMLGNIKFIGELGKLNMLHERILHQCVKQLLEKKKEAPSEILNDPKSADNEVKEAENLECLCHLIRTVGPRLDKPEAKAWMDAYYERIKAFRQNQKLPSRIRFMLQDIIDLRAQRWATRRIGMSLQDSGPRTIQQVREDAAKDMGLFLPGSQPGGQGPGMPLTAFEMPKGGPDFFSSGSSRSVSSQSPSNKSTGNDASKGGGKSVSFVDDIINGGGAGGGASNLPINLIGAAREEDDGRNNRGGADYGAEKRGVKLERLDSSRGLTDRQENDKSFDRVNEKDRPSPQRRGGEEEDGRGGGGGGSGPPSLERNEKNFGGRRNGEEESGRGEKDFGGKPTGGGGGGAPWGKQFDDRRRDDHGRMGDDDLGPPLSYRGGRGGGRGRGGREMSFRRDEPFPPFRSEGNQGDLGGSSYRGGQRGGFVRREEHPNDVRQESDRRGEEYAMRGRGGGRGRGVRGGRGGRTPDEKPRYGDGEMSAAQEAAQIKNAIFPQPKLTLKTSVLPLNTEEISLRPASFGGPPLKSSSATTLSAGKSKQKSPLAPESGADALTPQIDSLSLISNAEKAAKNKTASTASRTANTVASAAAATVPAPAAPSPPPFDSAATVEILKSVVEKALVDLPAESPATSQRSTPEPGSVGIVVGDGQDNARKLTREQVLEGVTKGVSELDGGKIPLSFTPTLLSTLLTASSESSASRSVAAIVVAALDGVEAAAASAASGNNGVMSAALQGFETLLNLISSLEATVPKIKSITANVAAQLVMSEKLSLSQVAVPLKGGAHFPLFLLTLQAMVKDPKHKEEAEARARVKSLVDESNVQLPEMVPQTSLPNLLSVFSDRGLGFLLPLLRLRVELTKIVKDDPSPKALYTWLQDHVDEDPQLRASADFIHILTSVLLTYIMEQTSDGFQDGSKSKEKMEQERLFLAKFSPILKKFVEGFEDAAVDKKKEGNVGDEGEEKRDVGKKSPTSSKVKSLGGGGGGSLEMRRQIALVYALQVFCHSLKWPKGLLLRLFTYMYDQEVVEEEAFLQWKEDLNDAYPGKGKALFQVNQWLTWLEQAESEEEDDA